MTKTALWLNAIHHLRIPFSIFLMPVYWFALIPIEVDVYRAVMVFIALHIFIYPASNGYNSYFDRDVESIGGLKHPPEVTRELWYVVLAFDLFSLLIALMVNLPFAVMALIYLLVSKAYSYEKIRLKKYPIIGAITVVVFQGFFTYLAVQAGAGVSSMLVFDNFGYGIVSTLFLLGSYPMTQIYQHAEDTKHGDYTLSRMLGIHGTFLFTSMVFLIASVLLCYLFYMDHQVHNIVIYLLALIPVNIYFLKWYFDYRKGKPVITFERTMALNALSSLLLSVAFISMLLLKWL